MKRLLLLFFLNTPFTHAIQNTIKASEILALPALVIMQKKIPLDELILQSAESLTLNALKKNAESLALFYAAYKDSKIKYTSDNPERQKFISQVRAIRIAIDSQKEAANTIRALSAYEEYLSTLLDSQRTDLQSQLNNLVTARAQVAKETLLDRFVRFFKREPAPQQAPILSEKTSSKKYIEPPFFDLIIKETQYILKTAELLDKKLTPELIKNARALQDDCYAARIRAAKEIASTLSLRVHDLNEYAKWINTENQKRKNVDYYLEESPNAIYKIYAEFLYCVSLAYLALALEPQQATLSQYFFDPILKNTRPAIYRRMKSGKQVLRKNMPLSLISRTKEQEKFEYEFFVFRLERSWYNTYILIMEHLIRAMNGISLTIQSQNGFLSSFFTIYQKEKSRFAYLKELYAYLKDSTPSKITDAQLKQLISSAYPQVSITQEQRDLEENLQEYLFEKDLTKEENITKLQSIDLSKRTALVLEEIKVLENRYDINRKLLNNPAKANAQKIKNASQENRTLITQLQRKRNEYTDLAIITQYIQKRIAFPTQSFPFILTLPNQSKLILTENELKKRIKAVFVPATSPLYAHNIEHLFHRIKDPKTKNAVIKEIEEALKTEADLDENTKDKSSNLVRAQGLAHMLIQLKNSSLNVIDQFFSTHNLIDPFNRDNNERTTLSNAQKNLKLLNITTLAHPVAAPTPSAPPLYDPAPTYTGPVPSAPPIEAFINK